MAAANWGSNKIKRLIAIIVLTFIPTLLLAKHAPAPPCGLTWVRSGADVNGDGTNEDLENAASFVLGQGWSGEVRLIEAATGVLLWAVVAEQVPGFGHRAVAVGDLNNDGVAELAGC